MLILNGDFYASAGLVKELLIYPMMNRRIRSHLPLKCAYTDCLTLSVGPEFTHIVRIGFYFRSSDSRYLPRFRCNRCHRSFSNARFSPYFGQKKRKLNEPIRKLLISGVSQRRIARLLHISKNTVAKKFVFLAKQAHLQHQKFLLSLQKQEAKISTLFFDEMESSERSKCLPVSIPIAVDSNRKILGFRVCSMPAKGRLAKISRLKYGVRDDERPQAAEALWQEIKLCLNTQLKVISDENPHYPFWIRKHFPNVVHETHPGRRGCVVGQGELKRGGFDPLFPLNHTAAMLRANINRLFRRTWCTTKLKERLSDHILLYVNFHNQVLTA